MEGKWGENVLDGKKGMKLIEYISALFTTGKTLDKFPCKKVKDKFSITGHYRVISGYASTLKRLSKLYF